MQQLLLTLLSWITLETGLAMPPPPLIQFSTAEIERQSLGGHEVVAYYDPDSATIYLHEDWYADSVLGKAVLLHELVHHVQAFNRVPARCAAAREHQAYHLTLKWLAAQGVPDPYTALNTDKFTIYLRSLCPGPEE